MESRARIKILRALAPNQEFSISQIIKITKFSRSIVEKHLDYFLSNNLIQEKISDRIKLYTSKIGNIRATSLKEFLEIWEGDSTQEIAILSHIN